MSEIDSQSSALAAIRLRSHSGDRKAELATVEKWAKANDNTYVLMAVRVARKQDARNI